MTFLTKIFRKRMEKDSQNRDRWAGHLAERVYFQQCRRRTIEIEIEGYGVIPFEFTYYEGPDRLLIDAKGEVIHDVSLEE